MAIHVATPGNDEYHCGVCGQRIKQVPGGQGLTYIHTASSAVAAPNPPLMDVDGQPYLKSGRTCVRRQNSAEGSPRFWVTFSDGTRYPTASGAQVNFKIENSDYDGDVLVTLHNGEIIGIEQA